MTVEYDGFNYNQKDRDLHCFGVLLFDIRLQSLLSFIIAHFRVDDGHNYQYFEIEHSKRTHYTIQRQHQRSLHQNSRFLRQFKSSEQNFACLKEKVGQEYCQANLLIVYGQIHT